MKRIDIVFNETIVFAKRARVIAPSPNAALQMMTDDKIGELDIQIEGEESIALEVDYLEVFHDEEQKS